MLGPLEETVEFVVGLLDRLAHLGRDIGGNDFPPTIEVFEPLPDDGNPFGQRHTTPSKECLDRLSDFRFALPGPVEAHFINNALVVGIDHAESHGRFNAELLIIVPTVDKMPAIGHNGQDLGHIGSDFPDWQPAHGNGQKDRH
jgi:hypothetical protein